MLLLFYPPAPTTSGFGQYWKRTEGLQVLNSFYVLFYIQVFQSFSSDWRITFCLDEIYEWDLVVSTGPLWGVQLSCCCVTCVIMPFLHFLAYNYICTSCFPCQTWFLEGHVLHSFLSHNPHDTLFSECKAWLSSSLIKFKMLIEIKLKFSINSRKYFGFLCQPLSM